MPEKNVQKPTKKTIQKIRNKFQKKKIRIKLKNQTNHKKI